jgi:hypothetical protein
MLPMEKRRFSSKTRIIGHLMVMVLLSTLYTNCGQFSSSSVVNLSSSQDPTNGTGSGTGIAGPLSCSETTLKAIYQSGYYGFIRGHNCALCHGTGGPGPAIGSDDLTQAFGVFELSPGQFVDSILNANAVDPAHHGAGTPDNAAAIATLSKAWSAALSANCSSVATTPGGSALSTYNYILKPKTVSLAPGASTDLTWQLSSEVTPAAAASVGGASLSITVTAAAANAIQPGYNISRVLITTTDQGAKVSGAKVQINGSIYKLGSTFVNSVADIPSHVDSFPLSRGNIFVAMTPNAGDTIALRLGNIEMPTRPSNFQMPAGGAVTFSTPAKFSELAAPGGPFAMHCVQCHNPVFKNGNLNVLDYASVMQFVTPGLYSSHGDPESAMISLVSGYSSSANVMPPKGALDYTQVFINPFISWFNSGAPNN